MKKISFIINASVNTLSYLKLLLNSLKTNLRYYEHEIIVFVDSDNEGTTEYLKSIKSDYYDLKVITHSLKPCVGYSRNSNLLVELASHDIVSYLQSDMVVCKDYDVGILEDIEDNCILSSTRIEPPLHGPSEVTFTANFGLYPNTFKNEEFLQYSESVKSTKIVSHFFAPFTFYKKVWLDCGGYDTLFRKSREDSDLLQRFVHSGVKIKQTYKSNVYHFTCVASRGLNWFDRSNKEAQEKLQMQNIADTIEMKKFIRKWGGFSHGEEQLYKYDIDLVLLNSNEHNTDMSIIPNIEPYFSRVWLQSEEIVQKITSFSQNGEHLYANTLLKFTEEDWQKFSKYYNSTDYSKIYKFGAPEEWNIKIEVPVEGLVRDNFIVSNPAILKSMINVEPGRYETDFNTVIDIRNHKLIDTPVKVENPVFDMELIQIH